MISSFLKEVVDNLKTRIETFAIITLALNDRPLSDVKLISLLKLKVILMMKVYI